MRTYRWTAVSKGHIMMGATMQHGPLSLSMRGSTLRAERIKAELSLQAVANKFRHGVTRVRIHQIENSSFVSERMAADFRKALRAAQVERAKLRRIICEVKWKFCDS